MNLSHDDHDDHSAATASEAPEAGAWMREVRAGTVCPRAHPEVTQTDIDDEIILYNPADGATHALNLTAALVWELCDGAYTLDGIAAEVASDFNVPLTQALGDVEALIARLYALGLVEGVESATSPGQGETADKGETADIGQGR